MTRCGRVTLVALTVAATIGVAVPSGATAVSPGRPSYECLLGPSTAPPFGTGECLGVRPGAMISTDEGTCTLNFVFRDPRGRSYVGTAGHCTLSADGHARWKWGAGPSVTGPSDEPIGRFVFATVDDEYDFGLIRLYDGIDPDPEMCVFGGPTGIESGERAEPFVVQYYGNGTVMGNAQVVNVPTLPARSALAPEMRNRGEVTATGAAIFGDSGAGVIAEDTGRAVGVLVGFRPGESIVIKRIGPAIAVAEKTLRTDLELVLAR
ncbi:MAG TPA: hypothetical protein VHN37_10220 [Actinomycetota bacterium]|nr:hypothetical protein [Actinomycetota bacterium]